MEISETILLSVAQKVVLVVCGVAMEKLLSVSSENSNVQWL